MSSRPFHLRRGFELSKWRWLPLSNRWRSVWERFGGSKCAPKKPPEPTKIFISIRILSIEVALRCFGKDMNRDKRFGMKNEAQNGSGLL